MPPTVALVNQKGGVGKTSVTLGLASAAWAAGDRVLVVDLDPQGSATWLLGLEPDDHDDLRRRGAGRAPPAAPPPTPSWPSRLGRPGPPAARASPGWPPRRAFSPPRGPRSDGWPRPSRRWPTRYDAILIDCAPSPRAPHHERSRRRRRSPSSSWSRARSACAASRRPSTWCAGDWPRTNPGPGAWPASSSTRCRHCPSDAERQYGRARPGWPAGARVAAGHPRA